MKINSIINRYIFFEMIPPFVISISFFTFVFLMTKILEITKLIVNYGISMAKVLLLLLYSTPSFLIFVIPMSVMMAVLLTFLRMSSDNEIIALKTGGVSLYRLLFPAMVFCSLGCLATALICVYVAPWGIRSFQQVIHDVASSNANIVLKERTFNESFEGVMLYVHKVDLKENMLKDVFIEDQRNDRVISTIIAPRGQIYNDTENLFYRIRLYDGSINQVDVRNKISNSVTFETYDLNLDLKTALTRTKKRHKMDEEEMYIDELINYIKSFSEKNTKYYKAVIELNNRFSIPLSCVVLGILALPLGVQSKATKKTYGLGVGLIFFLFYYLLLSMGWVLGESGTYPPIIGIWMPNVIMGGLGIVLLVRTATENPVSVHGIRDVLRRAGFHLKG